MKKEPTEGRLWKYFIHKVTYNVHVLHIFGTGPSIKGQPPQPQKQIERIKKSWKSGLMCNIHNNTKKKNTFSDYVALANNTNILQYKIFLLLMGQTVCLLKLQNMVLWAQLSWLKCLRRMCEVLGFIPNITYNWTCVEWHWLKVMPR